MDCFIAALKVGREGRVIGIDMTDAQLDKAERLRAGAGFANVAYHKGYIDKTGLEDGRADVVISNGVINLAHSKQAVFREAVRLLKPGGRIAISDIVTAMQLPDTVVCNADLWAACIGGAMQDDDYRRAIEGTGLRVQTIRDNAGYQFISANAKGAQQKWGVKSISVLALKS
jgi:arsenite methyltransferase